MQKGKFITIDGVEGAGKSTQIDFICGYLKSNGINAVLTREPGGTKLGDKVRNLLLNDDIGEIAADTELLLMFAARCEHIKSKIIPTLDAGCWVVSDRFSDSSYAYQGGGRGLSFARIEQLEKWLMGNFTPDITMLLDLPVSVGRNRIQKRGSVDRIESEGADFFERVRGAYIERSKLFPQRIKLVDASGDVDHTRQQIKHILDILISTSA